MGYGVHMSIQQNFTNAPAHAHLNLLGFVMSAIFAFYYHLVPSAQTMLGWVHFALHEIAAILMFPGIIMALHQGGEGLAKFSSLLAIVATLLFGFIVLRNRSA